jgi:hypothetical protein
MALNPRKRPIEAFHGFRYKHVRSENIEELINHMSKFEHLLFKYLFHFFELFRLWLVKEKETSWQRDCFSSQAVRLLL